MYRYKRFVPGISDILHGTIQNTCHLARSLASIAKQLPKSREPHLWWAPAFYGCGCRPLKKRFVSFAALSSISDVSFLAVRGVQICGLKEGQAKNKTGMSGSGYSLVPFDGASKCVAWNSSCATSCTDRYKQLL